MDLPPPYEKPFDVTGALEKMDAYRTSAQREEIAAVYARAADRIMRDMEEFLQSEAGQLDTDSQSDR